MLSTNIVLYKSNILKINIDYNLSYNLNYLNEIKKYIIDSNIFLLNINNITFIIISLPTNKFIIEIINYINQVKYIKNNNFINEYYENINFNQIYYYKETSIKLFIDNLLNNNDFTIELLLNIINNLIKKNNDLILFKVNLLDDISTITYLKIRIISILLYTEIINLYNQIKNYDKFLLQYKKKKKKLNNKKITKMLNNLLIKINYYNNNYIGKFKIDTNTNNLIFSI